MLREGLRCAADDDGLTRGARRPSYSHESARLTSRDVAASAPQQQTLSAFDAVKIMIGLVGGIGIFRTASPVAANVESPLAFTWIVGGAVTLIGALCYAELAAAHPHSGGEHRFLSRAYGKPFAVLFEWARGAVIQTGAIAAVVPGDYATDILPLGPHGPSLFAAISTLDATILSGARVYYAMGADVTLLPRVGEWSQRGKTSANALILDGAVALALGGVGAITRDGFKAMMVYTAPMFWGFMLRSRSR